MRWIKRIWTAALLLAATSGCKQQCFIKECDYKHSREQLAGALEHMPDPPTPSCLTSNSPAPATILDPSRPIRYMSLAEAMSISLESGTRGSIALNGQGDDTLSRFQGIGSLGSDQIRVLALDPAIQAATVESSLSKFDAFFQSSMEWNVTDRPIGTALDAFQAGRSGALNAIQTDGASFIARVGKPLPTGGVAGITFETDYQLTNLPAAANPSYTPRLQFAFEQPLLQGFGVEINQLRAAHPGTALLAQEVPLGQSIGLGQPTQEGILLTRIRYDQSRAEFEASVNQMVLNVEVAYWNLYAAYWNLYSRELGLRLAYESWRITRAKHLAGGAGNIRLADVARTRGQYELFRGQRITALGQVLETERQLRKLIGLPGEDGKRLVPSDTPTLAPYQPDWSSALSEAVTLRPELVIAREDLKIQQLNLIEKKNRLLPDLRAYATYDVNSLGTTLDGPGTSNAFRNLADDKFNNWRVGARLLVPLGFRQAHAEVRQARLNLARSYALLDDQERKARDFLNQQYRRLFEFYEQVRAQRAQREAYGLQLRLTFLRVSEGQLTPEKTEVLEAQRFFAEALASEYNAIAQYNNTLATFEYAKGTLLQHNNIVIGEGDLPDCARERAVAHHARRSAALVLKERPAPIPCNDGSCAGCEAMLPNLPADRPAALPSVEMEQMHKVPDDGEESDLPAMNPNRADVPAAPKEKPAAALKPPVRR